MSDSPAHHKEKWYVIINPNAGKGKGKKDWARISSLLEKADIGYEAVNGILGEDEVPVQEIRLGIISVGTGNDWGRMFGIPTDYAGAVETLRREKLFLQDAGIVRYEQHGRQHQRYFINIAGLGFDAVVVQRANRNKQKGKDSGGEGKLFGRMNDER